MSGKRRDAHCGTGFNVRRWCNKDPCGLICAVLSWFLVLYAETVVVMDHHCPWVNNCVGIGNHKFFLLFIFYVFCMSVYALILVFFRYARCMNVSCPTHAALRVIFLVVEAVLFGLFTLCMMCDQYSVILTGTTQIDRLKGEVSESLGIREVFGGASSKFSYQWLLPGDVWFPASVKLQLLGYVLEDELATSDDETTERESFLSTTSASESSVTMTETLEGGWSVEKHVPNDSTDVVV
ncbi:hypothetical protein P43SY_008918 [Pythium insidiosum]|uniref:Palmitoyltransferase n=1 Tax=Pythium insidiosum TaxID=114742 RepID=A0AAD5Q9Y0_PYTIN|nr:hypothetical protein P43SY_008918 [Pythium insidiosum]